MGKQHLDSINEYLLSSYPVLPTMLGAEIMILPELEVRKELYKQPNTTYTGGVLIIVM